MMSIPRCTLILLAGLFLAGCVFETANAPPARHAEPAPVPEPEYVLGTENTHNRFTRGIPPALRVPSPAVVEVHTKEATDGQLTRSSTAVDVPGVDIDPIHPLTGPIFVEGASPGDVLAVTLHEIETGEWGWTGVFPGFGLLSDEFTEPFLKTFELGPRATTATFADGIEIRLRPFAGVMGVAPDTDELLTTIPPRANGGNMDNPFLTAGTTVYFPVFVEGALFSIGDTHAVQGLGEVGGTGIEAPMRIVLELRVIQAGRAIREPEYETEEYYAVTAFATTLDEAVKKATRYMVDYLVATRGLDRPEAYALCSLLGDLHIAEVVDLPHVLVSMHMPKAPFRSGASGG